MSASPRANETGNSAPRRGRATASALRRLAASWLAFRDRHVSRSGWQRWLERPIRERSVTLLGATGAVLSFVMLALLPSPAGTLHIAAVAAVAALLGALHLAMQTNTGAAASRPPGDARFAELCETLEKRIEHLQDTHWEISESDVRYRDLLDAQSDVILRRDARGRLTFVNRAFSRVFGPSQTEAIGKLFEAKELRREGPAALTTADAERKRRRTVEIETAEGPRWIDWEEQLVVAGDGSLEVQAAGRDVTEERRRADELAEARDAAMSANRAKSRFLAAMSHEIRTPMNGILGMSGLLRETELSSEQTTYVTAVEQSARALLKLIDEILDFSKIEAGKLVLNHAPFSLARAAQGVVELLSPRAHEKGLDLALLVAPDLPETLIGDEARVRQILLNLLSNAVKFTDEGGISVRIGGTPRGSGRYSVNIEVSDSGIGLSDDDMRRLFHEFEQADAAHRRQQGGTGLGLAISRQLAVAMAGDIRVTSTVGKGSTFSVEIELGLGEDAADPGETARPTTRENVLLAFDRLIERSSLACILRAAGHGVVEAMMDGAEAAIADAAARGEPVTRLIVDVGTDAEAAGRLLAAARAANATAHVLGLVTVNVLARAGLSAFRRNGFERYLVRPVRSSTLLQQIARDLGAVNAATPAASAAPATDAAAAPGMPSDGATGNADAANIGPARRVNGRVAERNRGDGAAGATVLLVEDNDINALLARRVLERCGCDVVHCGNGETAVARALDVVKGEAAPFELVLMDIFMPGMDGIAAAAAIRDGYAGQPGGKAVPPIVALTANAFPEDRARYLDAGFDDYLAKPFDTADLAAVLQRWLPLCCSAQSASRCCSEVDQPLRQTRA